MRSEREADRALGLYADTVRRICTVRLKSYADTEDIFQNVFLKYVLSDAVFESDEHEKAWFIRVTLNECRDLLKSFFRSRTVSIEEAIPQATQLSAPDGEVLKAMLSLPVRYRDAAYLFYYEGYSALEISAMLKQKPNTVYTHLSRARAMLRDAIGGDALE